MKGCEAPWTLWNLKWFQVARTTSFGVKNRFLCSGGRRQGKGYSRNKRGILDGGVVVCEGGCRERHLSGCPVHQENQSLWQNKSKLIFLGLGSSGQTIWSSLELSLFPLGGFFFLLSVDILSKWWGRSTTWWVLSFISIPFVSVMQTKTQVTPWGILL